GQARGAHEELPTRGRHRISLGCASRASRALAHESSEDNIKTKRFAVPQPREGKTLRGGAADGSGKMAEKMGLTPRNWDGLDYDAGPERARARPDARGRSAA